MENTFKPGDKVVITAIPAYPYFKVGEIAILKEEEDGDWWAEFPTEREGNTQWRLSETCGIKFKKVKDVKRAKVTYAHTVDGLLRITGFEKFLSYDEIERVYGKETRRLYQSAKQRCCINGDTLDCYGQEGWCVSVGDLLTEQTLADFIVYLKKCGAALAHIRRELKKDRYAEEKEIII